MGVNALPASNSGKSLPINSSVVGTPSLRQLDAAHSYTPHTVWIGRKPVLNAFTMTAKGLGIKSIRISKKEATRVNKHIDLQAHCGLTMGQRAAR